MKTKIRTSLFLTFAAVLMSCSKNDVPDFAALTANTVTFETARLHCPFTIGDDATVESSGVCWSLNANPTISDSVKYVAFTNSVISAEITGLTPNNTYYARAFVKTTAGLKYSQQLTFQSGKFLLKQELSLVDTTAISVRMWISSYLTTGAEPVLYNFIDSVGYAWGTNKDSLVTVNKAFAINASGMNLTGLNTNTTYYYTYIAQTKWGIFSTPLDSVTTLPSVVAPD